MFIPLATSRQIQYLQDLTDKAEQIKRSHPSVIPNGLYHKNWEMTLTSEKAHLTISFYEAILDRADKELHPWKKLRRNEDLPM